MGPEVPLRLAGPGDVEVVSGLVGAFRDYLDRDTPDDEAIAASVPGLIDDPGTEFILAGASAVGMGTALFIDPRAPLRVADGLADWVARQGCRSVRELVGAARSSA